MYRPIAFVVLISCLTVAASSQKQRSRKDTQKKIVDRFITVSASSSASSVCQSNNVCSFWDSTVKLTANSTDPLGEELMYEWSVTSGKLSGEGRTVTWDLRGADLGFYTATVKVSSKKLSPAIADIKVEVKSCGICDPPRPPCPVISMSCPASTGIGNMTFVTSVSENVEPVSELSFKWTVTRGKIVSGQGTKQITVDGMDDKPMTATVEVAGFDPACRNTGSCTTNIW